MSHTDRGRSAQDPHDDDPPSRSAALVDTGAEFNLCNQRLLPSVVWQKAPTPVRLMAANGSVVPGADVTLDVRLVMNGKPQSFSAPTRGYNVPATIYGADIRENLILSYSWMLEKNVLVIQGCSPSSQAACTHLFGSVQMIITSATTVNQALQPSHS